MRSRYIISYDICDDRRLRNVAKIMESFGIRIQYSVFQCDLNRTDLVRLKEKLLQVVHAREDQVLFVNIGPADSPRDIISSLGRAYSVRSRDCVVV